jgi:drug/metabolite transporter (DMT)-like permease
VSWAVFLAALVSAALNAGWNVLAKRQKVPSEAVLGTLLVTALIFLAAIPFIGLPASAAWPWLAVAAVCNVAYSRALMAAYDRAPLSMTFSVVRAIIPPMLFVLGMLFFAEGATALRLVGMALVVISLVLFGWPGRGQSAGHLSGFVLAGLAGLVVSVAYACDIKGARVAGGHTLAIVQYGAASSLLSTSGLLAVALIEKRAPVAILKRNWRACTVAAMLLIASYFLALWAYTRGPVGLVAPVRETSILFGGVLVFAVLRERIRPRQWIAIGLAVLGAMIVKIQ